MDGGDLEELLGWPPELLIAPDQRNCSRKKRGSMELYSM
jgi:hypothetical protein